MEANIEQKKELNKEAILQFKKQMNWIAHLKNLVFVASLCLLSAALFYLWCGWNWLSAWIGIVGNIIAFIIVLSMRYKMKYLLLPWEMQKLLRNLGYW
jgi:Flp pilus assembly protein TadB